MKSSQLNQINEEKDARLLNNSLNFNNLNFNTETTNAVNVENNSAKGIFNYPKIGGAKINDKLGNKKNTIDNVNNGNKKRQSKEDKKDVDMINKNTLNNLPLDISSTPMQCTQTQSQSLQVIKPSQSLTRALSNGNFTNLGRER